MKPSIVFLSLCLLATIAHAQTSTLKWVKGANGPGDSYSVAITTDASGNIYTTGKFTGTVDFDPGVGVNSLTVGNGNMYDNTDIFIQKMDSAGNLLWVRQMKSNGQSVFNVGRSIAVDAAGNVYTTGTFRDTVDFDPGAGVANLNGSNSYNAFISKLDASGNFVYAKMIGENTGFAEGYSIFIDPLGNLLLTGIISGAHDLDPGPGVHNFTNTGIFVLKLDAAGNYAWANVLKGPHAPYSVSYGSGITSDHLGNVYLSGYYRDTIDFDPGAGTYYMTNTGNASGFILKLDASGNFIWADAMPTSGNINGTAFANINSISVDLYGNVYAGGVISGGTVDLDPGPSSFPVTDQGLVQDGFILKLHSTGDFIWAKQIGGMGTDANFCITTDAVGNVYTCGTFSGNVSLSNINPLSGSGNSDAYIMKLDSAGNYIWADDLGGFNADCSARGIAANGSGIVYVAGTYTGNVDFDPTVGTSNLIGSNLSNSFVARFSQATTGIHSNALINDSITIYPNPTNGAFKLTFSDVISNASVEIYNNVGALVYQQAHYKSATTIDLSDKADGLYFIKAMDNGRLLSSRMLLKNQTK